jgi:hypothetical protein
MRLSNVLLITACLLAVNSASATCRSGQLTRTMIPVRMIDSSGNKLADVPVGSVVTVHTMGPDICYGNNYTNCVVGNAIVELITAEPTENSCGIKRQNIQGLMMKESAYSKALDCEVN